MMHPAAGQVLLVAVAAVMLLLLLILRTRRASRLWLRVFPRFLRERLDPFFRATAKSPSPCPESR